MDVQCGRIPVGRNLLHPDDAVLTDGNGHTVLDIVQELLTQAVHNGHLHVVQLHISQHGAGQVVDKVGEWRFGGKAI